MACMFSLVVMILIDLRRLAHITFASAKASAKRGSFPDGNAPACRETMKVPLPIGTTPEFVAAQPAKNSTQQAIKTLENIICRLLVEAWWILKKSSDAPR
jgi:hypothetical protein